MGSREKWTLLECVLRSHGEEGLSAWHRLEGLKKVLLDGRRHGRISGWGDGWMEGWREGRREEGRQAGSLDSETVVPRRRVARIRSVTRGWF